jgi:glycine/D-amino acid oxidase-like deaminating enzyme
VAKSYDVAVIGAGVFGAWTAYHLACSGARVLLLDQYGPGNARSSSGGETRVIRMSYGSDEIYTRSSIRSLKLWKRLFAETGQPLFHKTGVLLTSDWGDAYLADTRKTLAHVGYRFRWLDCASLRKRFLHIRFDEGAAGVYEPDSGVLMARRAVQAVVDGATRAGVKYRLKPASAAPCRDVRAGVFVYACGPWLPALFPEILRGRIRPTRQEVWFFGTPPGDQFAKVPVWIAFREGAYSIPALDGRGFKLAIDRHGPAFDPENGSREITRAKLAWARGVLRQRFPSLADAPLVESRVCQYENTSNGDFLIDRHPGFPNVWLVGGGSGHGFKHGPFVGEYVAAQIAGTGVPEPRFSLASKKTTRQRSVY